MLEFSRATTYAPEDTSTANYCHALPEGSKEDWRVPTRDELRALTQNGPPDLGFDGRLFVHSSTSRSRNQTSPVIVVNLASGETDNRTIDAQLHAICVRKGTTR